MFEDKHLQWYILQYKANNPIFNCTHNVVMIVGSNDDVSFASEIDSCVQILFRIDDVGKTR